MAWGFRLYTTNYDVHVVCMSKCQFIADKYPGFTNPYPRLVLSPVEGATQAITRGIKSPISAPKRRRMAVKVQ